MPTDKEIIENLRKALEKSNLKNTQLRNELCEGYIFKYGLPPINDHHNSVASSSSKTPGFGKHNTRSGKEIRSEEKLFNIITDIYKDNWMNNPCIQWLDYNNNKERFGVWNSESDIQRHVHNILQEINNSYLKDKSLEIYSQTCISSALQNLVADLSVIKSPDGNVLGVVEVKKPATRCLSNKMVVTQITNYMQELHYTYSTQYVFGITTTYSKWKIYWLSNADNLAKATTIEEAIKVINSKTSNTIDEELVYHSKEYDYDDKELPLVLISCLYKMSLSPYNNPVNMKDKNAKFRCVTSNSEGYPPWKSLPINLTITYKYPHGNTNNFYLMQDYHGGRDGYVWLASTISDKNINLIVIKFSKLLDDEKNIDILTKHEIKLESLNNEADMWQKVWKVKKPRVECILGQPAIIMPFVFHCQKIDEKIFFIPPYRWTKDTIQKSSIFENGEIEENKMFDLEQSKKYIDNPIIAAKEALAKMLDIGYKHNDVKWSHVALMPTKQDTKWILVPVMIDLTDVEYIGIKTDIEKQKILKDMISLLA
jgi:hypothetical protein